MATNTILKDILGVKGIVVEKHETYTDGCQVKHLRLKVRVTAEERNRCPVRGRKCKGYDAPHDRKVWRALDCAGIVTEIVADNHRIECPEHGVLTASVPWAYHGSSFTKSFEQTVAWFSKEFSRSAIAEFMRIDWATVGRCISRVKDDLEPDSGKRLDGLVNIGIDETSYRKGHKYITVVVNHDTNTVVWVHEGHGKAVLEELFKTMSEEQRQSVKVVTGDGARWITDCVTRIPAFIALGKKIRRHFQHILNTIKQGISNARIEATNNKIKLIIRRAYGFRNIQNMMDMVLLICSNLRIPLPNRPLEKTKAA